MNKLKNRLIYLSIIGIVLIVSCNTPASHEAKKWALSWIGTDIVIKKDKLSCSSGANEQYTVLLNNDRQDTLKLIMFPEHWSSSNFALRLSSDSLVKLFAIIPKTVTPKVLIIKPFEKDTLYFTSAYFIAERYHGILSNYTKNIKTDIDTLHLIYINKGAKDSIIYINKSSSYVYRVDTLQ